MKKKIKTQAGQLFSSSEFYFDDCPICQAMVKAEKAGRTLDAAELAEAFAQAGKKGGVVGSGEPVSSQKGD